VDAIPALLTVHLSHFQQISLRTAGWIINIIWVTPFFWGNNYGMAAGDIDASGLWSTRPAAAPQARYSGLRYQKLTAGRTEVKGNLLASSFCASERPKSRNLSTRYYIQFLASVK